MLISRQSNEEPKQGGLDHVGNSKGQGVAEDQEHKKSGQPWGYKVALAKSSSDEVVSQEENRQM